MNEELNNEILPEQTAEIPELTEDTIAPSEDCLEIPEAAIIPEDEDDDENAVIAPIPGRKLKKGLLIGGGCLLGLILLVVITVIIFANGKLKLINRGSLWEKPDQQEIDDFLAEQVEPMPEDAVEINPDDIQWGDSADALEADGIINILLIGLDGRYGRKYNRSDTMILCTLNKHNSTLTLTSFMRDMYVPIPGYSPNRINASYVFGGPALLSETLEVNFGVKVDAYVEVNMSGFAACIDQMGGLDLELTQAEANYLINVNLRVNPEEPVWNLKAGMNHLNGAQALVYARNRSVGNGDFARTTRQKKIITAAINKAKTMNLYEINDLVDKFLPNVATGMTDKEIIEYTWTAVSMFDELQVKQSRIPADGAFYGGWVYGMNVLIPNLEKNRDVLAEIMKVE